MADIRKEIEKRRTFAIISHPDAELEDILKEMLDYAAANGLMEVQDN